MALACTTRLTTQVSSIKYNSGIVTYQINDGIDPVVPVNRYEASIKVTGGGLVSRCV